MLAACRLGVSILLFLMHGKRQRRRDKEDVSGEKKRRLVEEWGKE